MSDSSDSYDCIIVGGGPAGSSAAIHLATGGARVLLVEQKKFPREKLCGEFISPECLEHFRQLGVAESMGGAGGVLVTETRFYSRKGASISVPSERFGQSETLALGLSRAEMDERLLRRACSAGAHVLENARATALLMEDGRVGGVRVKVGAAAREYSAPVTIDATGRSRALSRGVERPVHHHRAPFVAFKTHVSGARSDAGRCEIYSFPGGYGGLVPVEGGLSNLCFIVPAMDARARGGNAEKVVREIVMTNKRARWTLESALARTEWLGVGLEGFGRCEVTPAEGLLTVGDAASFIDPFTGSGMLMALESGELAARAVARWLDRSGGGAARVAELMREYRALYGKAFGARLRVCSVLRRAVFIPRLADAVIFTLGASDHVRRRLARSTRPQPQ
jgi:geranylgeranyl reductase family protein